MTKPTYVYLMKDLRTEFYKIGFSKNPKHREKTLQSEQPLIMLVETWEGTLRDEKQLHKKFESTRIRGEWFALKQEHVAQIYKYFYGKPQPSANDEVRLLQQKNIELQQEVYRWKGRAELLQRMLDKYEPPPNPESPNIEQLIKEAKMQVYLPPHFNDSSTTEKPKYVPPDFPSEDEVPQTSETKRLLEETKLSRLPKIPRRFALTSDDRAKIAAFKQEEYQIPELVETSPEPGVVCRYYTGARPPMFFMDEVPF